MSVVSGRRVVLTAVADDGERWVIARAHDGLDIGFVAFRAGQPEDGWLTIREIELEEGQRGWGYGSEAVRLLEEGALWRGRASRFRADVNAGNGLALYFWLRLGYRPATEDEAFWREARDGDMLSMIRVVGGDPETPRFFALHP